MMCFPDYASEIIALGVLFYATTALVWFLFGTIVGETRAKRSWEQLAEDISASLAAMEVDGFEKCGCDEMCDDCCRKMGEDYEKEGGDA